MEPAGCNYWRLCAWSLCSSTRKAPQWEARASRQGAAPHSPQLPIGSKWRPSENSPPTHTHTHTHTGPSQTAGHGHSWPTLFFLKIQWLKTALSMMTKSEAVSASPQLWGFQKIIRLCSLSIHLGPYGLCLVKLTDHTPELTSEKPVFRSEAQSHLPPGQWCPRYPAWGFWSEATDTVLLTLHFCKAMVIFTSEFQTELK